MPKNYIELQISSGIEIQDHLDTIFEGTFLGLWEQEGVSHLYWRDEGQAGKILQEIETRLASMGLMPESVIQSFGLLADQDWNSRWTESIKPIRVGERFVIRQSWNAASLQPGDIELVIDPKRAFGSGYHQTTRLLIELLEQVVQGGERLLDWGTGSGILAMAAIRLGARWALGIDNDPDAIEQAAENALMNGFGSELELQEASLEDVGLESFDLILANLDRLTLLKYHHRLGDFLRPGGTALLSGMQVEDYEEMSDALTTEGFQIVTRRELDDWLAIQVRTRSAELKR